MTSLLLFIEVKLIALFQRFIFYFGKPLMMPLWLNLAQVMNLFDDVGNGYCQCGWFCT